MHKTPLILTSAWLLLVSGSSIAKDFPGMKELMSEQEFRAAGLDKLSADELKALNNWLLKYTTDDVPELVEEVPELKESVALKAAVAPAPAAAPQPEPEPERIESRIPGEFKGWTGKTVFKLENGQIWKQRRSGRYYHKMTNPEVVITKNLMGFYEMKVVETGKRVGVKRIR